MQVINVPLVSNPWPNRRKQKCNRQKSRCNLMDPVVLFYEFAIRISQNHQQSLDWIGRKYMQVINNPLVSNPWPNRRKQEHNRQKPWCNTIDPGLLFHKFAIRIPQTYEQSLQWIGRTYIQVINSPLVSSPLPNRRRQKCNRQKPWYNTMVPGLFFYKFAIGIPQTHE